MNITDIINSIYKLPASSLDTLINLVSEVEYPKNYHLFRKTGKTNPTSSKKESSRRYVCTEEKEITFWLGKEGDLMLPLQTLLTG